MLSYHSEPQPDIQLIFIVKTSHIIIKIYVRGLYLNDSTFNIFQEMHFCSNNCNYFIPTITLIITSFWVKKIHITPTGSNSDTPLSSPLHFWQQKSSWFNTRRRCSRPGAPSFPQSSPIRSSRDIMLLRSLQSHSMPRSSLWSAVVLTHHRPRSLLFVVGFTLVCDPSLLGWRSGGGAALPRLLKSTWRRGT